MDIKECHRVLELEIGATRLDIDNAYCRLLERWHPDRVTPASDAAAVREAALKVQAVNEAYQILIKTAPKHVAKLSAMAEARLASPAAEPRPIAGPAETKPAEPAAPRVKPVLNPLTVTVAPVDKRPTSAPPPRPTPPSAPLPVPATAPAARTQPPMPAPAATPTPPPAVAPAPPPAPKPAVTATIAPMLAAAAPPPAPAPVPAATAPSATPPPPKPTPMAPAIATPASTPLESTDLRAKIKAIYDGLFPPESPRRRYGPAAVAGALLFLLLLAKCGYSSLTHVSDNAPPDPKKTGIVVVKTNRADTAAELVGVTSAGKPNGTSFHGNGAQPTMSGLPPGKYILTARSEGWPDIQQDVTAEKGRTTEIAVHFKTGSLRLDSDPAGAAVRLGEADLGKTPLVIPQLPPGEHLLALTYAGLPPAVFKAIITENVEAAGTVRLPYGKLTVESFPAGATVLVGGKSFGQTPLFFERFPAGNRKITLQAKDFPPLEISIAMEDRGEIKVSPELGNGFPELDPQALLRTVWQPEKPDEIADRFDAVGGPQVPRNGIVRNLNRKALYEKWLRRGYRYSGIIKGYEKESGKVEFAEQKNDLAIHRIVAELTPAARNDKDLVARLTKGATFNFYGRLNAVEESRWSMVISFEFSGVEPLRSP